MAQTNHQPNVWEKPLDAKSVAIIFLTLLALLKWVLLETNSTPSPFGQSPVAQALPDANLIPSGSVMSGTYRAADGDGLAIHADGTCELLAEPNNSESINVLGTYTMTGPSALIMTFNGRQVDGRISADGNTITADIGWMGGHVDAYQKTH